VNWEDNDLLKMAQKSGVEDFVRQALRATPDWADGFVAADGMLARSLGVAAIPAIYQIVDNGRRVTLTSRSQSDILRIGQTRTK
jgi:hypothetical protein